MPGQFNMWFSQTKVLVEGGCYVVAPRQDDKEEQHWGKNESFVEQKFKRPKSALIPETAKHLLTELAHICSEHSLSVIYIIMTYRRSPKEQLTQFKIVMKFYYGTQTISSHVSLEGRKYHLPVGDTEK